MSLNLPEYELLKGVKAPSKPKGVAKKGKAKATKGKKKC